MEHSALPQLLGDCMGDAVYWLHMHTFQSKTKPHSLYVDDTWWMLNAQCVIDSHNSTEN